MPIIASVAISYLEAYISVFAIDGTAIEHTLLIITIAAFLIAIINRHQSIDVTSHHVIDNE